MAVADRHRFPIGVWIAAGQRGETTLVRDTLRARFLTQLPERLIGDRAYDSDGLDAELKTLGIEMIAPHHPRRRRITQAGWVAESGGAVVPGSGEVSPLSWPSFLERRLSNLRQLLGSALVWRDLGGVHFDFELDALVELILAERRYPIHRPHLGGARRR